MSNVKIDHIFSICSLNTDGEWFTRMKCEGDETASCWGWIFTQHSSIYLKLE